MKLLYLFTLPFLFFSLNFTSLSGKTKNSESSSANELTDLKSIKYASNLLDWKNHKVDSLVLDIYYPPKATSDKKYPLILFCHAGGFSGGNRFNVSAICDRFADEGFIAVGFDYRTGYEKNDLRGCTADTSSMLKAIYRAIQDANACLRYLTANANQYNIDTAKVFVGGSSAGATLALNSSYINDSIANASLYFHNAYTSLGGTQSSGNSLTTKYSIKGIVDMWGVLFSDQFISPDYRAYKTIIFKGEEDGGSPDSVGYFHDCPNYPIEYAGPIIYSQLQNIGVPSVYHFLPEANHPAYDNMFCVQQSACFLRSIISGSPSSGTYSHYQSSCH